MKKSERDKYWTELIQTCRVTAPTHVTTNRIPNLV